MSYLPGPLATENVRLPRELLQSTKHLAENAHDL
jgi:hypothetical protein